MNLRLLALLAVMLVGGITWLVFSTGPRDGEEATPHVERAESIPRSAASTLEERIAPEPPLSVDAREAAPTVEDYGRFGGARGELTIRVVLSDGSAPRAGVDAWIENEFASQRALEAAAEKYRCDVAELEHAVGTPLELDENGVGRALSPRHALRVAARAPGLAGWTVVAPDEAECVVTLEPSHDLSIRMIDGEGRPCGGAMVAAWRERTLYPFRLDEEAPAETTFEPIYVAQADDRGLAVLRDIESHVDLDGGRWRIGPILIESTPEVTLVDPLAIPDKPLVFRLEPGASIEVVVHDKQGRVAHVDGFAQLAPIDTIWRTRSPTGGCTLPFVPFTSGRARFDHVGVGVAHRVTCGPYALSSLAQDVSRLSLGERRVVVLTLSK